MSIEQPAIERIAQIAIVVHDTERAVHFYRDVLGLKLLFTAPPGLAFFDCGGIRLMLSPPDKPEFDHPGSILYYKVADIEAAHRALVDKGVAFDQGPHLVAKLPDHELWLAFFRDSEGNFLSLLCEKR